MENLQEQTILEEDLLEQQPKPNKEVRIAAILIITMLLIWQFKLFIIGALSVKTMSFNEACDLVNEWLSYLDVVAWAGAYVLLYRNSSNTKIKYILTAMLALVAIEIVWTLLKYNVTINKSVIDTFYILTYISTIYLLSLLVSDIQDDRKRKKASLFILYFVYFLLDYLLFAIGSYLPFINTEALNSQSSHLFSVSITFGLYLFMKIICFIGVWHFATSELFTKKYEEVEVTADDFMPTNRYFMGAIICSILLYIPYLLLDL